MQTAVIATRPSTMIVITSSDLRLTTVTGAHSEVNDYAWTFVNFLVLVFINK